MGSRKVWGLRGYVFLIAMQTAGSTVWHGVQGWYGAKVAHSAHSQVPADADRICDWQCLEVVIASIIPSFVTIPDTLNGPVTPSELISCLLFWAISIPLFLLSPDKWKIPGRIALSACAINIVVVTLICVAKGGGP